MPKWRESDWWAWWDLNLHLMASETIDSAGLVYRPEKMVVADRIELPSRDYDSPVLTVELSYHGGLGGT